MTLEDFYNTQIDNITREDIDNAYFMMSLIGDFDFNLKKLPQVSVMESVVKSLDTFNLYKSDDLKNEINIMKSYVRYYPAPATIPFYFNTQMFPDKKGDIVPTIVYPMKLDKTSYAFLGHEFHHALKDVHCKERSIRDRVSEVIPMFYEMICADSEDDLDVSKEILKRRLTLLESDKPEDIDEEEIRQLQYFNSYYYALALFNRYEDDRLMIFRLISRVLTGEISTLDLLEMLDIYNSDLDYVVSKELNNIKEYIRK